MTTLSAQTIKREGVIQPCLPAQKDSRGCSRGLSACGYDLTLAHDVILFPQSQLIGVTTIFFILGAAHASNFWLQLLLGSIGAVMLFTMIIADGKHFALAGAQQYFNIPTDVVAKVHDKSSLARIGVTVQNTVAEPGWRGFLTLELTNHGRRVVHLREGDAIAQVIFDRLDEPTELPYEGKYQDQEFGPQEAR